MRHLDPRHPKDWEACGGLCSSQGPPGEDGVQEGRGGKGADGFLWGAGGGERSEPGRGQGWGERQQPCTAPDRGGPGCGPQQGRSHEAQSLMVCEARGLRIQIPSPPSPGTADRALRSLRGRRGHPGLRPMPYPDPSSWGRACGQVRALPNPKAAW